MKTSFGGIAALVFMLAAVTADHPTAEEMRGLLENNQQRFPEARRISFRQLCFSFAREGDRAQDVAGRAFRKVSGQPVDSDAGVASLADHFMFQSYYGDRTAEQIANVFGTTFARALFRLKPGSWQGPIESESGWHLVWIDSITPARVPSFRAVSDTTAGRRSEVRGEIVLRWWNEP
jgi:peptidyl-prolyl cis-trans isomerase C